MFRQLLLASLIVPHFGFAEAYPVYKFHLQERGLIEETCRVGKESVASKINIHPIPQASNDFATKTHLKFKLCLTSSSRRKESFSLYLPTFMYDSKGLLELSPSEEKLFSNLPSTQRPGDFVDVLLKRLPNKNLKQKNTVTKVVPFELRWIPKVHQSKPEYPTMTFYLAEQSALKTIRGFKSGMNQWIRLEVTVELLIGPDLEMYGDLHEITIEGAN